jgi:hypothetical protein
MPIAASLQALRRDTGKLLRKQSERSSDAVAFVPVNLCCFFDTVVAE